MIRAGICLRRMAEATKVRRMAGSTAARRATATADRCKNILGGWGGLRSGDVNNIGNEDDDVVVVNNSGFLVMF